MEGSSWIMEVRPLTQTASRLNKESSELTTSPEYWIGVHVGSSLDILPHSGIEASHSDAAKGGRSTFETIDPPQIGWDQLAGKLGIPQCTMIVFCLRG